MKDEILKKYFFVDLARLILFTTSKISFYSVAINWKNERSQVIVNLKARIAVGSLTDEEGPSTPFPVYIILSPVLPTRLHLCHAV